MVILIYVSMGAQLKPNRWYSRRQINWKTLHWCTLTRKIINTKTKRKKNSSSHPTNEHNQKIIKTTTSKKKNSTDGKPKVSIPNQLPLNTTKSKKKKKKENNKNTWSDEKTERYNQTNTIDKDEKKGTWRTTLKFHSIQLAIISTFFLFHKLYRIKRKKN